MQKKEVMLVERKHNEWTLPFLGLLQLSFMLLWEIQTSLIIGISFAVSALVLPKWIAYAQGSSLVDSPDHRKHHAGEIPTMGGIAFYAVMMIAGFFHSSSIVAEPGIMVALVLLLITGVADDRWSMPPIGKLMMQLTSATLMVRTLDLEVLFFSIGNPMIDQFLAFYTSVFLVCLMINAVNFLDGINGLAGGIGMITSLVFAVFFAYVGEQSLAVVSLAVTGGCLGFLRFNYPKARVFMGDTGSMFLGWWIALCGLWILSGNIAFGDFFPHFDPLVFVIAMFFLPVFDTFRIISIRLSKKQNPMQADRRHLHHILLDNGFHAAKASIVLWTAHAIMMVLGFGVALIPMDNVLFPVVFFAAAIWAVELLTFKKLARFRHKTNFLEFNVDKQIEASPLLNVRVDEDMPEREQKLVWIVEDDPFFNRWLSKRVQAQTGLRVRSFFNAHEVYENQHEIPDLVVVDHDLEADLGAHTGLDVLYYLNDKFPQLPKVVMSGQDSTETACAMLRAGAWDYVCKEDDPEGKRIIERVTDLLRLVKDVRAQKQLVRRTQKEKVRLAFTLVVSGFVGLVAIGLFW